MSDLADNLLDLVRPQLKEMVESMVEERLDRFVPPPPEPWMTAKETAVYLRISVDAVRQRAQRGTIPAHKDEGRWIFRRQELDAHFGIS